MPPLPRRPGPGWASRFGWRSRMRRPRSAGRRDSAAPCAHRGHRGIVRVPSETRRRPAVAVPGLVRVRRRARIRRVADEPRTALIVARQFSRATAPRGKPAPGDVIGQETAAGPRQSVEPPPFAVRAQRDDALLGGAAREILHDAAREIIGEQMAARISVVPLRADTFPSAVTNRLRRRTRGAAGAGGRRPCRRTAAAPPDCAPKSRRGPARRARRPSACRRNRHRH